MFNNDTFSRFRLISIIEGISYLILIFIAMPLKYFAGIPEAVKSCGMAHGIFIYSICDSFRNGYEKIQLEICKFSTFCLLFNSFGFILIEKTIMKTPPKKA